MPWYFHCCVASLFFRLRSQQRSITQTSTAMAVYVWIYYGHSGLQPSPFQKVWSLFWNQYSNTRWHTKKSCINKSCIPDAVFLKTSQKFSFTKLRYWLRHHPNLKHLQHKLFYISVILKWVSNFRKVSHFAKTQKIKFWISA